MKIYVSARPNSKDEKIEKTDETHFTVAVKEPPKNGRANEAIMRAVTGYLGISRSHVHLVSGFSSRQKIFEIL